jgi:hypothetical protein
MTDGKQGAIGIRRITFEQGRIIVFRYNGAIQPWIPALATSFGAVCKVSRVTPILQAYDLEGVGSANGDRTRI